MTGELLTIGEVASRSGMAVSAVRHYEAMGLIASTRTPGGQRRFTRAVLRRIAVVQAGRRVGLSLREIAESFAAFGPDHEPSKRDWVRLSRRWRPLLDARIRELEAVRDGLAMCVGCGCLTMRQCAIYNPADELAATGSGARRVFPADESPWS